MIALRPRDQHVWDPRPLPHETEAETKTNYCETEAKNLLWDRDKTYETETKTSPVKSIACESNMFYFFHYTHEVNDEPEINFAFKMIGK